MTGVRTRLLYSTVHRFKHYTTKTPPRSCSCSSCNNDYYNNNNNNKKKKKKKKDQIVFFSEYYSDAFVSERFMSFGAAVFIQLCESVNRLINGPISLPPFFLSFSPFLFLPLSLPHNCPQILISISPFYIAINPHKYDVKMKSSDVLWNLLGRIDQRVVGWKIICWFGETNPQQSIL